MAMSHAYCLKRADEEFLSSPMYKFYRTEYSNLHDAQYHWQVNYAPKPKKNLIFEFINSILGKFENMMLDLSMRDINSYLSQATNRFDLENRQKKVMYQTVSNLA